MEEKKFDTNSIIGFLLLGAIMLYYMYTNQPEQSTSDISQTTEQTTEVDDTSPQIMTPEVSKTLLAADAQERYGNFAYSSGLQVAADGTSVLENDFLKLTFSNKGAQITEALVKNYQTYDALPLYMIQDANASFNVNFGTTSNRIFNTKDMVFQPQLTKNSEGSVLSMKLKVSENEYLEYRYELLPESYMIGFSVKSVGLSSIINSGNPVNLTFDLKGIRHEKSMSYENQMTALYYEKEDGKMDDLSISGEDSELENNVDWVGFKQHFFSTILLTDTPLKRPNYPQTLFFRTKKRIQFLQNLLLCKLLCI